MVPVAMLTWKTAANSLSSMLTIYLMNVSVGSLPPFVVDLRW